MKTRKLLLLCLYYLLSLSFTFVIYSHIYVVSKVNILEYLKYSFHIFSMTISTENIVFYIFSMTIATENSVLEMASF